MKEFYKKRVASIEKKAKEATKDKDIFD